MRDYADTPPLPVYNLLLALATVDRYNGGRFVRRCLLQYYPSDRTASVILQSDARRLDRRKGKAVGHYAKQGASDTWDRAKQIFEQSSLIIVSQKFHCERAIFLADNHQIDAV